MTEKRFERWNDHSCKVKDNQEDTFLNWEDVVNKLNEQQATITALKEENEQLKKEKEGWKVSTCQYMNKDSILAMDFQIFHEALFELERLIEEDTEQMERFNDLKKKFKSLVNHYLGVFDDE